MQGGIADHTAYLAHHLTSHHVRSSILISHRWNETETDSPSIFAHTSQPQPIMYPVLPNWSWRCWSAIQHYLTTYQPDVLHIQYQAAAFDLGGWVNWLPWYLKRRGSKTKVVTTLHDLRIPYIFPKAGLLRWQSMLALARHSDAVICTNREDVQRLEMELSPKNRSSLNHIPLGSNVEANPPDDFDRMAWRAQYQVGPETLLLAYFGFLNESKGGEELIEALALLRQQDINAQLLFIGGDVGHADPTNVAYAQKVQGLIDQYNLRAFVHRTGYVDLAAVSANLLAADAVVMPYRDGVSFRRTTLIAALRHGCSVISTIPNNPTSIPEIQAGKNMLLAHPHDPQSLAETIAPLATDETLRETLSAGAKELGNLFEWDAIAQQTRQLYQRLKSN